MITVNVDGLSEYKVPQGLAEIKSHYGMRGTGQCTAGVVALPEPIGATTGFKCHTLAAPVFDAFFKEVHANGLWNRLQSWGGCYNNRMKRRIHPPQSSTHSWGIAFDINPGWNRGGADPPKLQAQADQRSPFVIAQDSPIVAIAAKYMIRWGGAFKDGMHFQLCWKY